MESIKAHLLSLLDEVVQTLELAKKVKANDKKEVNKLLNSKKKMYLKKITRIREITEKEEEDNGIN